MPVLVTRRTLLKSMTSRGDIGGLAVAKVWKYRGESPKSVTLLKGLAIVSCIQTFHPNVLPKVAPKLDESPEIRLEWRAIVKDRSTTRIETQTAGHVHDPAGGGVL